MPCGFSGCLPSDALAHALAQLHTAAASALARHRPWLEDVYGGDWPVNACGDTCSQIFRDLKELMRPHFDLRALTIIKGFFDTIDASENDPSSLYGNHWGRGHTWIQWGEIIIDPTASQFLGYLPEPLLIATPSMLEYGFYLRTRP
jgi:hypothetical protein